MSRKVSFIGSSCERVAVFSAEEKLTDLDLVVMPTMIFQALQRFMVVGPNECISPFSKTLLPQRPEMAIHISEVKEDTLCGCCLLPYEVVPVGLLLDSATIDDAQWVEYVCRTCSERVLVPRESGTACLQHPLTEAQCAKSERRRGQEK